MNLTGLRGARLAMGCAVMTLCVVSAQFASLASAATVAAAAPLTTARSNHSATQMTNGKLLVVGGQNGSPAAATPLSSVETYDPFANAWSAGAALASARSDHTATLLDNGRVLVVGGRSASGNAALNTAQLYDSSTNTWINAGNLSAARSRHTATRLRNGKVLVIGGQHNGATLSSAEIYDPATNAWTSAASMATARERHTATAAAVGIGDDVWVIGGTNTNNALLNSIERYSASTNSWFTFSATLNDARHSHTATALTNGDIVIAGGNTLVISGFNVSPDSLQSVEVLRALTVTVERLADMRYERSQHSATLLPSGRVMVMGGVRDTTTPQYLTNVETYDAASDTWTEDPAMGNARAAHTSTLLPTGALLAVGGRTGANAVAETTTMARMATYSSTLSSGGSCGERVQAATTLLADGRVLITGGARSGGVLSDAFIFNPSTQACAAVSPMPFARRSHTLTLLPSGKVLAVGGFASDNVTPTATSALYDPSVGVGGTWTSLPALPQTNAGHTATLLPDGRVLVFGGRNFDAFTSDLIQYFDPATSAWSTVPAGGSVGVVRASTLLPDGRVFFTSGGDAEDCQSVQPALVLNPATNAINAVTSAVLRCYATATLLANGKVLIVGGRNSTGQFLANAEVFDPATQTSTLTPALSRQRYVHTATLLASGEVLVAGGTFARSTTEIYDPISNTWRAGPALQVARRLSVSVAHPSGKAILLLGADAGAGASESIGVTPLPNLALTPTLNAPTAALTSRTETNFTGNAFRPSRESSGGNTSQSASNAPVFEIQRVDNGQRRFFTQSSGVLSPTLFSDTAYTASADSLVGFPRGHAFVRAWVNGVPSEAKSVLVATTPDAPAAPTATVTSITSATVTFSNAEFFNGGSAITKLGVDTETGVSVGSCNVPCGSVSLTGLTPGTTYRFRAFATNTLGEGGRSPLSNSITLPTRGSTTTVVSSLNPSIQGQAVMFTATVSVAGGAPLVGGGTMLFRAESNVIAGCSAVPVTIVNGNNVASCTSASFATNVQNYNISATFSGDAQTSFSNGQVVQTVATPPSLNIDASTANGTANDAATDGLMILRLIAGFTGDAITNGAMHATATRTPQDARLFLDNIRAALDVNGDGRIDAANDGLLIVRYMRGLRLATGLFTGIDIGAVMTTAQIEAYLQLMMP